MPFRPEELFNRGFLIERLVDLTKRPWLAGAISYVLFVGGHLPGSGLTATLTLTAIGSLTPVGLIFDAPVLLAG